MFNRPVTKDQARRVVLIDDNEALAMNKEKLVETLAHKLKGSCLNIGAIRMAENCSRLEKLAKRKHTNEGISVVELIELDFKQTLLMLNKYMPL